MTSLHVTMRDLHRPRFGIAPSVWVELCLWKIRLQEHEMIQVQSLEWPSGYVGFERITPRLQFYRAIAPQLRDEESHA